MYKISEKDSQYVIRQAHSLSNTDNNYNKFHEIENAESDLQRTLVVQGDIKDFESIDRDSSIPKSQTTNKEQNMLRQTEIIDGKGALIFDELSQNDEVKGNKSQSSSFK